MVGGNRREAGAAETAETAGDLGDGGGVGGQDGGGSVTTGYVMEDGQEGIEQPAARRAASAPATSSAQRTRAAKELGCGTAAAAGKAEGMREAPQQQTTTAGKKKKKTR